MLSVIEYLEESASSEVANDDKGKLHELLLARHLHPEGKLPNHFRAESVKKDHAGTPTEVHDKLKAKIHSDAYKEIDNNAKQLAHHVRSHLEKNGHIPKGGHIASVHWTSNRDTENVAGDHEKLTGHKDSNSNADLIVSVHKNGKHHSHHGISVKYGSQKKPNLKNSGVDSLEKQAGLPKGTFAHHQKEHDSNLRELGYKGNRRENHDQHRIDRNSTNPKIKKKVAAATASSLESRKKMASAFNNHMMKKSDSELRDHIRNQASPTTHLPHTIAHSHVKSDGTSNSIIHGAHDHVDHHLSQFHSLHMKPAANGISATIYGTHHKTGKIRPVAKHTIKAASGPHKGAVGTFKL